MNQDRQSNPVNKPRVIITFIAVVITALLCIFLLPPIFHYLVSGVTALNQGVATLEQKMNQQRLELIRKTQGESAVRRDQMQTTLKPLNDMLAELANTRQLVVNDLTVNQDVGKRFAATEESLKAKCQEAKVACQITSFDEARLRSCEQLALPMRELNKIVRYRKQLEKNSELLQGMLPKIDFLVHDLNYDIDMIVATGGGNTQEAIDRINNFIKDFSLPSSDISKIADKDLPSFSLQETWDLIGKP